MLRRCCYSLVIADRKHPLLGGNSSPLLKRRLLIFPLAAAPTLSLIVTQQQKQQQNHALSSSSMSTTAFTTTRWFSTNKQRQKKKQKKTRKTQPLSATAGRIVLQDQRSNQERRRPSSSKTKLPKLCVGCGTEVVVTGSSSSSGTNTTLLAGEEAVDPERSRTKSKKARYVDVLEQQHYNPYNSKSKSSKKSKQQQQKQPFLCHRCQALQSDNIWEAYDALRDVEPSVFMSQLRHIVARRRFGLCVLVVDATDAEHSAVRNLRRAKGSTPVVLCLNKIDLVPRMNWRDQREITRKLERTVTKFIGTYAVSAETGAGVVNLARGILEQLGGRDVFVVGAANVGKSTLVKRLSTVIAESVYLKGSSKQALQRRHMAANLSVTGSNLPGTTLQAVRVPCFPSKNHAMWDTPGVINSRALQYSIFPAHLMEPLTHPGGIEIPNKENGLAVQLESNMSLLIEAPWMVNEDNDDDDDDEPCVLARLDLFKTTPTSLSIFAQAYLHPSLSIRVVSTANAPTRATIPSSHIERIKERIVQATGHTETGLRNEYSLPLKEFANKDRPHGEFWTSDEEFCSRGKYHMDIVFASLGWISVLDERPFSVIPYCVEGSVFSKRPARYPVNLEGWLDQHWSPEHIPDEINKETKREIRMIAKEGRHTRNWKRHRSDIERNEIEFDEWRY